MRWVLVLAVLVPTLAGAEIPPEMRVRQILRAADSMFHEGQPDATTPALAEARKVAGEDVDLVQLVEYYDANWRAYQGDFAGARDILEGFLARGEAEGAGFSVAAMANTVVWVYWAMDDLDGALKANARVRAAIERGWLWEEEAYGWLHHYWWDRAYLLVDKAARTPDDKAALAAAEEARTTYKALGVPSEDKFGIAAIDAFFAGRLGDRARARAVARTVDWKKREDVQDLYIWAVAVDLFDPKAARKLRGRVAEARYLMVPVQLRAMARDAIALAGRAPKKAALARLREVRGYVKHDKPLQAQLDEAIQKLAGSP